jgi:hypothetical protein
LSDGGDDIEVVTVVDKTRIFESNDKRIFASDWLSRYQFNLSDRMEITVQRHKKIASIDRISGVSSTISASYKVASIFVHPVVDGAYQRL